MGISQGAVQGRDQMEVERSRAAVLRLATVYAVDVARARASVLIDGIESAPLPWLVLSAGRDRMWWTPNEGEQVLLFSPDGLPESGVILGGVYSDRYPSPRSDPKVAAVVYRDTSVVQHDTGASRYTIEIAEGGEIVLTGPTVRVRAETLYVEPYARAHAGETDHRGDDRAYDDSERLGGWAEGEA